MVANPCTKKYRIRSTFRTLCLLVYNLATSYPVSSYGSMEQVGIADGLENEGSVVRKNLCFPPKRNSQGRPLATIFFSISTEKESGHAGKSRL